MNLLIPTLKDMTKEFIDGKYDIMGALTIQRPLSNTLPTRIIAAAIPKRYCWRVRIMMLLKAMI